MANFKPFYLWDIASIPHCLLVQTPHPNSYAGYLLLKHNGKGTLFPHAWNEKMVLILRRKRTNILNENLKWN
jgi:hypothetical protein